MTPAEATPPAPALAIALARRAPHWVGRRRGYRVMDRTLGLVFGAGLRGRRRVAHGCALLDYDLEQYIERLMAYEWFGEEPFAAARLLLRPGDTFVDAGAHAGYFSAMAAGVVGPGGRVVSIEANPRQAARLRAHAALNAALAPWNVVEGALAHRSGETLTLHIAANHGDATLAAPGGNVTQERVAVRTVALDEVAADWGPVALMKIDIEGAEPMALEGGARWFASPNAPAMVLAEFNPALLAALGSSPRALLDRFTQLGYAAHTLRWRGTRRVAVAPAGPTPDLSRNTDLLLVRPEGRERLALLEE